MTDQRADGTTEPMSAIGPRLVVTVLSSAVAGPVLLAYGMALLWFSPEITSPGGCRQETGGFGPDSGTVLWGLACAAGVAGVLCFGVALARLHTNRRWWPWLVAAAAILAAGSPAVAGLPDAAWCPPLP
ncbi:hypothetical protein ACN263_07725 [Micromonospora sp. WMMD729]|uniref:hypothetical protein n=1 Tax=Micromonospora sp. WMMD729 TaxID=3404127 RepID=UPI003BF5F8FD